MQGYINSRTRGRRFAGSNISRFATRAATLPHVARSAPTEPSLARSVQMIADQLPQLCRLIELELNGERHDTVRHAFAAAQARKVFFRRHRRELLALRLRCERCDLAFRKHVVV